MEAKELRYIVMMLNPQAAQFTSSGQRIETHDGEIFCSIDEAREYANDSIKQKLCTRFAIGMFVIDMHATRMSISVIETYGFKNDKQNVNQLELFT
jgi:hypothetical protein